MFGTGLVTPRQIKKKLTKIFNKIDLDKSKTIDRKEFHAFLTAALEVTTGDNVLFEKIWNVVLDIGNEDGERKNDIALLGLKKWLFRKTKIKYKKKKKQKNLIFITKRKEKNQEIQYHTYPFCSTLIAIRYRNYLFKNVHNH